MYRRFPLEEREKAEDVQLQSFRHTQGHDLISATESLVPVLYPVRDYACFSVFYFCCYCLRPDLVVRAGIDLLILLASFPLYLET